MYSFRRILSTTTWFILSLGFFIFIIGAIGLFYLELKLPDVETLENIKLQVPLRIYSSEGDLIAEYGEKRRVPVSFDEVPKPLIYGLLATEDQRFFEHPGVDLFGLARAAVQLIKTGSKAQGGSTITMQVARNFFLNRKKTYIRKLNEILLAIKIDHYFTKDKVLELYLNKIYLGNRAYGVAAAAHTYYGKTLSELTLAEMAMIAGLPQAPSAVNPISNPVRAKKRRNHVLARMLEENYIDEETYQKAIRVPITANYHGRNIELSAPYIAEFVRLQLTDRLNNSAYTSGYKVFTTITREQQLAANLSVREGLEAYDKRHGYRGPLVHLADTYQLAFNNLIQKLEDLQSRQALGTVGYVTRIQNKQAQLLLSDKKTVTIAWEGMAWAQKQLPGGGVGPKPKEAHDILHVGDVILTKEIKHKWTLYQIPEVEGALVAMSPKNGAIKALVGGFSFRKSHFNRVVQAERQPGSCFKPFIYSAALEQGYTLATMINDAPIVQNDPSLEGIWRPQNDNRKFAGPTSLRNGLVKSRNLVSIRLLDAIGIDKAVSFLDHFGFKTDNFPHTLSLALGTVSISPLDMAKGYSVFANGGYLVEPYLISEIKDVNNRVVFKAEPKINDPESVDVAPQIIEPRIAYLIMNILQDVIQNGTGRGAKILHRHDLAGKTGTTNDKIDAWFAGFIPNELVTVSWVGFDQPETLHEYASKAALPIWVNFMRKVLPKFPEQKPLTPSGLITVKIDPQTGLQGFPGQTGTIFEMFREENVPQQSQTAHSDSNSESDALPEHADANDSDSHLF